MQHTGRCVAGGPLAANCHLHFALPVCQHVSSPPTGALHLKGQADQRLAGEASDPHCPVGFNTRPTPAWCQPAAWAPGLHAHSGDMKALEHRPSDTRRKLRMRRGLTALFLLAVVWPLGCYAGGQVAKRASAGPTLEQRYDGTWAQRVQLHGAAQSGWAGLRQAFTRQLVFVECPSSQVREGTSAKAGRLGVLLQGCAGGSTQ